MKAIIEDRKYWSGIIKTPEEYESYRDGKIDWTDTVKSRLDRVTIPYETFLYLVALDKKEEKGGGCNG